MRVWNLGVTDVVRSIVSDKVKGLVYVAAEMESLNSFPYYSCGYIAQFTGILSSYYYYYF